MQTISPTSCSCRPKVIHLFQGEHGEILGRLEVDLALVRSFSMASATLLCLHRWIVPLLLEHTDIGSVFHNRSALCSHVCDSTAFLCYNVPYGGVMLLQHLCCSVICELTPLSAWYSFCLRWSWAPRVNKSCARVPGT